MALRQLRHGVVIRRTRNAGAARHHILLACSVLALAVGACSGRGSSVRDDGEWTPSSKPEVMGVPMGDVKSSIETELATLAESMSADRLRHVKLLYAAYGNAPLWLEDDGFDRSRSTALLRGVLDASTHALRLEDYPLDALLATVGEVREAKRATAAQLAGADVMLTSTYVQLAKDMLTGQIDPKSVAQDWHIATGQESIDSAVVRSLRDPQLDSAIARMRPLGDDYEALRRALVTYRDLVAAGGWNTVPAGKALKPGETDQPVRLAALRARLRAEGYGAPLVTAAVPASAKNPDVYDDTLAGLVADFQARHGIAVDSTLGEETIQSLNQPVQYRLAQIAANLERYRWLPRSLGGRYIVVNVPAFRLEAHDSSGVLTMKVIVGSDFEGRVTPVFADSMEWVVFRPYWNITPDIQEQETAPRIAADPNYMDANDLEYFEQGGEQRIRQKPGPKNSLGLVKFMFPNSFNVYLHDTPNDALFAEDVRAFSHGCIRLEQPDALAQWVLGWDAARVEDAMQRGPDDQWEKLEQRIPVYIVYATAYEREGQLYFGNDLYDRDDSLVAAMTASVSPAANALRRLEALRTLVED